MRQPEDIEKPSVTITKRTLSDRHSETADNGRKKSFFGFRAEIFFVTVGVLVGGTLLFSHFGIYQRPFLFFKEAPAQESFPYLSGDGYGVYRPDGPGAASDSAVAVKLATGAKTDTEIIEETSAMKKSESDEWWLSSGGFMYASGSEFSTNIGPLKKKSGWKKRYAKNNSVDTDQGYFPQNIFRLVTRSKAKDFAQSIRFNVQAVNLSGSPNRNQTNGILFLNRYQNGGSLYYAGVRVDGDAIIKKKYGGKYYTLAKKKVFPGVYEHDANPMLIPFDTWIGVKSEIRTSGDGAVDIRLSMDQDGHGWVPVVETTDESDCHGDAPILSNGYAGIRTDFMDVTFKDYLIEGR